MSDAASPRSLPKLDLRGRAVRTGVAAALLVAVGATGACGAVGSPATQPSIVDTTTATTTAASTPTPTATAFAGDLETIMLQRPDGAQEWIPDTVKDGMSDLDRSAALWNPKTPDQIAKLLTGSGFQRSKLHAWQDAQGNVVIIDLMQFDRPAYDWLAWAAGGLTAGNSAASGHIREVDSGKWAEFVAGDNHQLALVFGRGPFGVVLRVHADNAPNLDLLTALAIEEYAKLA